MSSLKHLLSLVLCVLSLSGCQYQPPAAKASCEVAISTPKKEDPSISVWIHGTRLLPTGLFYHFFHCDSGLHHFSQLDHTFHTHKLVQSLCTGHPERFAESHCYFFGWSGKLNAKDREQAARDLYHELKKLRQEYTKIYSHEPKINLITHSHGGNLALNLARVKDSDDVDFSINELILLACPVQKHTLDLIADPLFNKVYSLYSTMDMIQVLDPQGLKSPGKGPLFSQRVFPAHTKLIQVRIKCDGRGLLHIDFILKKFTCFLGSLLDEIDSWWQEGKYHPQWDSSAKMIHVDTKKQEYKKYLHASK